jgi:hypothetical protein
MTTMVPPTIPVVTVMPTVVVVMVVPTVVVMPLVTCENGRGSECAKRNCQA